MAESPEGGPPELCFIEPALADRAILLVFWDYTCPLSLRTIPFLSTWHRRYTRFGLTIIGVHTPEFSFGAERAHVAAAVAEFGIRYPVVLDNDLAIWKALDNRFWPRSILLDREGQVVLDHPGPVGYAQIATHLVTTLAKGRADIGPWIRLPAPSPPAAKPTTLPSTPDLHGGFLRSSVGNREGLERSGATVDYAEAKLRIADRLYLSGPWRATGESLIAMPQPERPAALQVRATAAEVSAVLRGPAAGTAVRVVVDGRPVPAERSGRDLEPADGSGRPASLVRASAPRLYRLVRDPGHGTLELALEVEHGELEVFALRFRGGTGPVHPPAEPAGGPATA